MRATKQSTNKSVQRYSPVSGDEPVHHHALGLADPVAPGHRLDIVLNKHEQRARAEGKDEHARRKLGQRRVLLRVMTRSLFSMPKRGRYTFGSRSSLFGLTSWQETHNRTAAVADRARKIKNKISLPCRGGGGLCVCSEEIGSEGGTCLRVPVTVVDDARVCGGEVDAHPSRPRGQEEHEALRVSVEPETQQQCRFDRQKGRMGVRTCGRFEA